MRILEDEELEVGDLTLGAAPLLSLSSQAVASALDVLGNQSPAPLDSLMVITTSSGESPENARRDALDANLATAENPHPLIMDLPEYDPFDVSNPELCDHFQEQGLLRVVRGLPDEPKYAAETWNDTQIWGSRALDVRVFIAFFMRERSGFRADDRLAWDLMHLAERAVEVAYTGRRPSMPQEEWERFSYGIDGSLDTVLWAAVKACPVNGAGHIALRHAARLVCRMVCWLWDGRAQFCGRKFTDGLLLPDWLEYDPSGSPDWHSRHTRLFRELFFGLRRSAELLGVGGEESARRLACAVEYLSKSVVEPSLLTNLPREMQPDAALTRQVSQIARDVEALGEVTLEQQAGAAFLGAALRIGWSIERQVTVPAPAPTTLDLQHTDTDGLLTGLGDAAFREGRWREKPVWQQGESSGVLQKRDGELVELSHEKALRQCWEEVRKRAPRAALTPKKSVTLALRIAAEALGYPPGKFASAMTVGARKSKQRDEDKAHPKRVRQYNGRGRKRGAK